MFWKKKKEYKIIILRKHYPEMTLEDAYKNWKKNYTTITDIATTFGIYVIKARKKGWRIT